QRARQPRHVAEGDAERHREREQPAVEVREEGTEREDGAEVGHEAGGEDHLPEAGPAEPGLHHHGVDDSDRGGGERDAADERALVRPARYPVAEAPGAQERRQEGDETDRQRRLQVNTQGVGVDLGAGEEGEEDRPEAGEEVDPFAGLQAEEVAADHAIPISISATEMPVRIETRLATKASTIHAAATNQTLVTCAGIGSAHALQLDDEDGPSTAAP